ncbi:MAG: hypothetical protein K6T90_16685 [Leptolyngbyaceae cyanobacterium HOT.MB2.61]|nr:hypothetical protein [Leptolyngbyaceae cyanobacterium HOT.MB2.61]
MSRAERLNNDSDLSESAETAPAIPSDAVAQASESATTEDSGDEGWQTLDFPGAMSVDAIPKAEETVCSMTSDADPEVLSSLATLGDASSQEMEAIAPPVQEAQPAIPEEFSVQFQRLQRENRVLRDRIVELEQDLTQQQIELQLELARSLHTASTEPLPPAISETQQAEELAAAQERVNDLLKELDISRQSAQRQRILVETLTEQLESSQERIAQLERDCALAQQRYNEQVQKLLQAENTCRDLRTRLHRQQQQTLQFKAALEKCLEMPPARRYSQLLNLEDHPSIPTVSIPPSALSQVLAPKNQPVRPWSAASEAQPNTTDTSSADLPRPLSKLLHPNTGNEADRPNVDTAFQNPLRESKDPQATTAWVNQLFSDASTEPSYPIEDGQPSSDIFDLSPFLQSENTNSNDVQANSAQASSTPPADEKLLQMLAAVPLDSDELGNPLEAFRWGQSSSSDNSLWDDLAKLIDPPVTGNPQPAESSSTSVETVGVADDSPVPENLTAPEDLAMSDLPPDSSSASGQPGKGDEPTARSKKPLELIAWSSRSDRQPRSSHLRPVPPPTPTEDSQKEAQPAAVATSSKLDKPGPGSSNPSASNDLLSASWPSPVVYPLRSSRKLKSLAAVDLPTFPKAR